MLKLKFKIKNTKYINTSKVFNKVLAQETDTNIIDKLIKGKENVYHINEDTEFTFVKMITLEDEKYIYVLLESAYSEIFVVRGDNVKVSLNKDYVFWSNDIDTIIASGNTTVLKTQSNRKYIARCQEEDDYDLEKAVMLLLLKQQGFTYQDISIIVDAVKIKNN